MVGVFQYKCNIYCLSESLQLHSCSRLEKFPENLPQFIECDSCWCYDCKHNENNEAEPRDFGGEKKPCPSCRFCVENQKPEICQIGSYKNGCKLRAEEDGFGADT